jgi:excisionase family DNA binding protein
MENLILTTPSELQFLIQNSVNKAFIEFQSTNETFKKPPENEFLNFSQTCEYLGLAAATLYTKTSSGSISFYRTGKKLIFKKSELEEFITTTKLNKKCSK